MAFPARRSTVNLPRMKISFRSLGVGVVMFGLLTARNTGAQEPDLEIAGATVSQSGTEVMLIHKSTGNARWLKVGQSFAGYTTKSYDADTGRLTVIKGEASHVISLNRATVKPAEAAPATPEQQKSITHNLRQLSAAADQYFLEQGVATVNSSELIGPEPNKYIREMKPVAGETYLGIRIEQGKPIRIKTAGGFEMEHVN